MNVTFAHNPASQTITVKKGATQQFVFFVDKGTAKDEIVALNFDLAGAESDFEVIGLIYGHHDGNYPFDVKINHLKPRTTGRIWLKTILKDQAKQEIKAMISIPKGAVGTDSYLSHKTLVLSPDAKTKTIPSLEILEDDVKASHGATVGQIDQDQLFYLRSRGFREKDARGLIVDGFLEDLIAKIKDTGIADQVRELAKNAAHKND